MIKIATYRLQWIQKYLMVAMVSETEQVTKKTTAPVETTGAVVGV